MAKYFVFVPSFVLSRHEIEANNVEEAIKRALENPNESNLQIMEDKSITFNEDSWRVTDEAGEVVREGKTYMIIEATKINVETPEPVQGEGGDEEGGALQN